MTVRLAFRYVEACVQCERLLFGCCRICYDQRSHVRTEEVRSREEGYLWKMEQCAKALQFLLTATANVKEDTIKVSSSVVNSMNKESIKIDRDHVIRS